MRSLTPLFITPWTMPASIKWLFQESQRSKTFSSLCSSWLTFTPTTELCAPWEMCVDNDKARTSLKGSAGVYRARENFCGEGSELHPRYSESLLGRTSVVLSFLLNERAQRSRKMWGSCVLRKPKTDHHPNGHMFFHWVVQFSPNGLVNRSEGGLPSQTKLWNLRGFSLAGWWWPLLNPEIEKKCIVALVPHHLSSLVFRLLFPSTSFRQN